MFNTRIAQANLITKTDFDAKLSSLNRKTIKNKADHLLVQNELNKLKTFDFSYFRGKNYFDEAGNQNYYIFQPLVKYLKTNSLLGVEYVLSWKSRGLNETEIESVRTNNYLLNPCIDHCYDFTTVRLKFNGSFLNRSPSTVFH